LWENCQILQPRPSQYVSRIKIVKESFRPVAPFIIFVRSVIVLLFNVNNRKNLCPRRSRVVKYRIINVYEQLMDPSMHYGDLLEISFIVPLLFLSLLDFS
jgi:hypothetical protein